MLDLDIFVDFFVEFERALIAESKPGGLDGPIRDVNYILHLARGYSNCEFIPLQVDFTTGLDVKNTDFEANHIGSLILNKGNSAEIYINDVKKADGTPLINYCYRRFLLMKEMFHAVLREEFIRHELPHPDADNPEELKSLIERLLYLPMSIVDFDDPDYTDAEKIEHAAELLATLILYPIDRINADRSRFLSILNRGNYANADVIMAPLLVYAEEYKVPKRYVNLLFRWDQYEYLYSLFEMKRKKIGLI